MNRGSDAGPGPARPCSRGQPGSQVRAGVTAALACAVGSRVVWGSSSAITMAEVTDLRQTSQWISCQNPYVLELCVSCGKRGTPILPWMPSCPGGDEPRCPWECEGVELSWVPASGGHSPGSVWSGRLLGRRAPTWVSQAPEPLASPQPLLPTRYR